MARCRRQNPILDRYRRTTRHMMNDWALFASSFTFVIIVGVGSGLAIISSIGPRVVRRLAARLRLDARLVAVTAVVLPLPVSGLHLRDLGAATWLLGLGCPFAGRADLVGVDRAGLARPGGDRRHDVRVREV